jgi:membrane-associated phospholipid phosphatase
MRVLIKIAFWNTGAPAYRWNELLVAEALKRNMSSPVSGRALALLHAAIYDATVAAWDSKVAHNRPRPSAFDPSLTTAIPNPNSPAYPCEHAVAAGAASAILGYLFPDDAKRFADMASEAGNAFLLAGVQYPSDVKAGLELGGKVAQLAIERAKNDGSTAKWTGTVPTEAGHWTGENPALPLLGTWKTWALTSGSQFRPPAPPAYNSPQMAAELKELQVFTRTPKTNGDAMFWEFGAGGLRNFVFWNDQISRKLMKYRLDDNAPRAARAYALTSIAYYDAIVACFDAKYAYWSMRPFQLDPNFKPLFTTPNHPSYPSAHSCLSGSAAAVLANLFPRDAATFNGLAVQAGEARIWGGIHFRSDVDAGLKLSRQVADLVLEKAK